MSVVTSAWMADARCAREPARRLPWLADEDGLPWVLVDLMRDVCDACPVRGVCEAYVVNNEITGGWWAGVNRASQRSARATLDALDRDPVPIGESVQMLLSDLRPELWEDVA